MIDPTIVDAWNNFVMRSDYRDHAPGSVQRAATVVSMYWGAANNGGINSFLTCTWEIDAQEVLDALTALGALIAAKEFGRVLSGLSVPLPPCSQDERWDLLERRWLDELDELDVLSKDADEEIQRVLERHVSDHAAFYLSLE